MSNTTSIRRAASIAGATGLIALSMAGPASARPNPGNGGPEDSHCTTSCFEGGTTQGPSTAGFTPPDGGGFEVLQLGAGILAGLALAGAGMAVASRRTHGHAPHPA